MAQDRTNTYITVTGEHTIGGRVRHNGETFRSSELTEAIFQKALAGSIAGVAVSAEQPDDNFKVGVADVTFMLRTLDGSAVVLPGSDANEDDARFSAAVPMEPVTATSERTRDGKYKGGTRRVAETVDPDEPITPV